MKRDFTQKSINAFVRKVNNKVFTSGFGIIDFAFRRCEHKLTQSILAVSSRGHMSTWIHTAY